MVAFAIANSTAQELARLGGTMPELKDVGRRQSDI